MLSKKQRDQIEKLKTGHRQQELDNKLGIISHANHQLLNDTQKIHDGIICSSKGEKSDIPKYATLEKGFGLAWSNEYLTSKSYDTTQISLKTLLTDKEIQSINDELNRPLAERLKWDNWDYVFVFSAAVLGSVIDLLFGDPKQGLSKYLSDKNTLVGSWFETIHEMHHNGSPMDYQGFKMGGGNHRLRSIGHDLLGFVQGIWQIKNGTFTGGYYQDGKWFEIISDLNKYGNRYDPTSWDQAIWRYVVHVFCDFFSSKSIPVPCFGYLSRMPIREIRKFADDMYNGGYNLRHMFVQSLSIAMIEIVIRPYVFIKHHKMNIEKESLCLKQREMRLMAHALTSAFNVGKVIITKNPLLINLPQILFTCYQFWPIILFHSRNNDNMQKLIRNLDEIGIESERVYLDSISTLLSGEKGEKFMSSNPILM